jgi:hypothetical protein
VKTSVGVYLARARGLWLSVSGVLAAALALSIGGVIAGWWDWLPIQLHQLASLCMVSSFVLAVRTAPAAEAFRLGMEAGAREHARHCLSTCGHTCQQDAVVRIPQPIR